MTFPPRLKVSVRASKSSSMDGPNGLCNRSPYVVSITTFSACGGVAGLRSSRRPALPRSPENSTLVEWLCSESCRKMLAEPRIWPASMKVALHAGGDFKNLGVDRGPSEIVEAVHCVEGRIERACLCRASHRRARPCAHGERASSSSRWAASSMTSRANSREADVVMISPRNPRLANSGRRPQ